MIAWKKYKYDVEPVHFFMGVLVERFKKATVYCGIRSRRVLHEENPFVQNYIHNPVH